MNFKNPKIKKWFTNKKNEGHQFLISQIDVKIFIFTSEM
jgi:hypothetical protein